MFTQISQGLHMLFSVSSIFTIFLGVVGGIIIGALPGLTATMAVALLIPITFGMDPAQGLALMGGVYSGAMYGGSISAILLHTPGTPAAAATAFDGYPMAQKGEGGKALAVSVIASFVGGIVSTFALLFISPILATVALSFGPPEYFLLAILGLTTIVTLTSENLAKGLASGIIGLLLATIGTDPITGYSRFTFGSTNLLGGIPFMPTLIGLFSLTQVLILTESDYIIDSLDNIKKKVKMISISWKEIKRLKEIIFSGSIIGTVVGILPGAGATIAAFLSYNTAKMRSKHPEKFGTGIPDGIAASESANNAVVGGSLVPLLTLGIPGNSVAAALLGGLMIQGLIPGPELFKNYGDITYAFILSLFIANIFMLILGLFGAPYFSRIITLSNAILIPSIIILSVIGSYAIRNNLFDVWLMFLFGIIGYFLDKLGFSLGAIVLGLILGPIAESGLGRAMILFNYNPLMFFTRPISLIIIFLIIAFIIPPLLRTRRRKIAPGSDDEE